VIVLRLVLIVHLAALTVYTAIVIANHGANLLPVFFGDIAAMAWPGQFNLDFLGFLILSALWTAWRSQFSALGWLLAVVALFGGMMFLSIYLLILSFNVRTIPELLLGNTARNT
jgi:hypothetical protein